MLYLERLTLLGGVKDETYELDNTAFLKWCAALAFCIFTTCFLVVCTILYLRGFVKSDTVTKDKKKKRGQRLKKKGQRPKT